MSTHKTLDDRRQALEESFFKKANEKLLAELRQKRAHDEQRQALADVIKLQNDAVLDHLVDAGISAQTWLAISLVPLVEVAWADHKVERAERQAIMKAAADNGVVEGSAAAELLDDWLTRRPLPGVRQAWTEYIQAVVPLLGDAAREALREETLEKSRAVALSAGGFLGFGDKISENEAKVLEELGRAF
jgi:hypothetical protein